MPAPEIPDAQFDALTDVVATSPTSAWALGQYRTSSASGIVIEHWDGVSWTAFPRVTGKLLEAISSAQDDTGSVWAVGAIQKQCHHCWWPSPYAVHWRGGRWREDRVPHSKPGAWLDGVLALPGGSTWAVGVQSWVVGGGSGPLIDRAINETWSEVHGPPHNSGDDYAITGTSDIDVWILGASHYDTHIYIDHWDGSRWTSHTLPHREAVYVSSIAETSPSDVWIAGKAETGSTERPYLAHFDGTSWSPDVYVPVGGDVGALNGIYSTSSGLWTVGSLQEGPSPYVTDLFTTFAHC